MRFIQSALYLKVKEVFLLPADQKQKEWRLFLRRYKYVSIQKKDSVGILAPENTLAV